MNKLGITSSNNIEKEILTYSIGSKGSIPIALALMIASGYKNAIARYLSILTHSQEANKWQHIILRDSLSISEKFNDDFEGLVRKPIEKNGKPFDLEDLKPVPKDWFERKANPAHDEPLPFRIYANQFAKMMCMRTPQYMTDSESVVMTCPRSYINFWQREEFKSPFQAVDIALEHILSDVIRVLKLRNMPFNEQDMTLPMPEYKGYEFKYDYGW